MGAPKLKYSIGNSASTSGSSTITNTDTSVPLTSTTNFQAAPTPGEGLILIDEGQSGEEIAYATALSGGSLTVPLANRGLEGTAAAAHSTSSYSVKGVFTAAMWNDMITSLKNWFSQTTGAVTPALGSDATGDVYYRNSGGLLARLGIGTSGQVLNVAAGLPAWATAAGAATDGWTSSSDTWVYASASTFTIAGVDRTSIYTKGTRLKFTNSTLKYAVVVASAFSTDTTVTIAVNTDYVIANAAISSPSYSYQLSPQGYPTTFAFSPTINGATGTIGTFATSGLTAYYSITGNLCNYFFEATVSNVGSWTSTIRVTTPVTPSTTSFYYMWGLVSNEGDLATNGTKANNAVVQNSTANIVWEKNFGTAQIVWGDVAAPFRLAFHGDLRF